MFNLICDFAIGTCVALVVGALTGNIVLALIVSAAVVAII